MRASPWRRPASVQLGQREHAVILSQLPVPGGQLSVRPDVIAGSAALS
jgi:hypothetical protein